MENDKPNTGQCSEQGCPLCSGSRPIIVVLLAAAVAVTFWLKSEEKSNVTNEPPSVVAPSSVDTPDAGSEEAAMPKPGAAEVPAETTAKAESAPTPAVAIPTLVEIGSDQCIPCKAMAPIIDALREDYQGRMKVDFINVRLDPAGARKYGIAGIPTQVFLDASGKEVTRHLGPISREDILATWEQAGITFEEATTEGNHD